MFTSKLLLRENLVVIKKANSGSQPSETLVYKPAILQKKEKSPDFSAASLIFLPHHPDTPLHAADTRVPNKFR